MRRGDTRALLLAGLLEGRAHGYELMQRLGEHSGGQWRPSPGSVYPQLQQLEDEGLVTVIATDGRRVYELTDLGRDQADPVTLDRLAQQDGAGDSYRALHRELDQLHLAVRQITAAAEAPQIEQATVMLRTARQSLYRLLADQD
jgi:DNA-binding PadR family transcriptional regulator